VRDAHNLTAICEPIIYAVWDPLLSQAYRPARPVTSLLRREYGPEIEIAMISKYLAFTSRR
jgi:hypothetical protein